MNVDNMDDIHNKSLREHFRKTVGPQRGAIISIIIL